MGRALAFVRRHPAAAAAVGYALVVVVLLWPSIRPGRTLVPADILDVVNPWRQTAGPGTPHPHNPVISDASFQFFPWVHFLGDAWRHGGVPGWNPLLLGGVPVVPNGFVSPAYPGFWLVRFLDPFDAYNWFVALHLWLAALGCWAFARAVGVRSSAAWIAGLAGLGAGMWVHWSLHLVHLVGMVGTVWALAASHRVITRPTPGRVVALAAVFALWWLGANPQYAYFGSLAVAGYGVALIAARRGWPARRRSALAWVGGLVLGAALAAPVLVPTARTPDRILRSHEPVSAMTKSHLPAGDAIRLLVPNAAGDPVDRLDRGRSAESIMDSPFLGVAVLVLVGAAVGVGGRALWLLAGTAAVVVLLAFTGPLHAVLHAVLPGYDRFRGSSRWCAVLPAFAIPLGAAGLDAVLAGDRRARRGATIAAAALLVGLVAWLVALHAGGDADAADLTRRAAFSALLLAAAGGAAWIAIRWPRTAAIALLACVAADVVVATPRWYPSLSERDAFPSTVPGRIAAARGGRIVRYGALRTIVPTYSPNLPMVEDVADVQGAAVLFPADYDRYLRLIDRHGTFAKDTNVAPDLSPFAPLRSPRLMALDVRTVLAEPNVPVPGHPRLLDDGDTRVYATTSWGAAVVVRDARPSDDAAMWRSVARRTWDPVRTAAVVGLDRPVRGTGGTVKGGATGPGRERWRVDAPRGGFLRVSGNFDSGWSARVDGRATDVLRADGIFRGVVVPPGRHVVTFRYRNGDERTGRRIAAVALLALLVIGLGPPLRRRLAARARPT